MSEETNAPQTPVEDATIEEKQAFLVEYNALVEKHQIDFAQYPVYIPDGQGGFRTVIQTTPVSIKNQPKRSPFVQQ